MNDSGTHRLGVLRARAAGLGVSEAKVAAVVLARPGDVVEWSTAELAHAAGTSAATVIRACQRMGYRGFQHLRLELARLGAGPADDAPAAKDLFDAAVAALRLAQSAVDTQALATAATMLGAASRLLLVGGGFSGPPLQDLAMRLATIGVAAQAPIDPLAQQFCAHALSEGDVVLALSYSGANSQTVRACAAAQARGARVVAVTSYLSSPLARLADVAIATGAAGAPHDIDPPLARLAHAVVLSDLLSHLASHRTRTDVESMRAVVADAVGDEPESRSSSALPSGVTPAPPNVHRS